MKEKIRFQMGTMQTINGSPSSPKHMGKYKSTDSPISTTNENADITPCKTTILEEAGTKTLNVSNWDQNNIDRLLLTYNSYIECADCVGLFNVEIFQKWKQLLIK